MTTNPNAVAPLPSDLAAVVRELESGSPERGATALRQLAHAMPSRTEWPYLPFSSREDTPENHARRLETVDGGLGPYLARAYRDYRWTVTAGPAVTTDLDGRPVVLGRDGRPVGSREDQLAAFDAACTAHGVELQHVAEELPSY